ncbi:MAG: potassium-transporting ATPase subunit F [Candidatus Nanopelagicales bacterium]
MSAENLVGLLLAIGIVGYLVFAVLFPEKL